MSGLTKLFSDDPPSSTVASGGRTYGSSGVEGGLSPEDAAVQRAQALADTEQQRSERDRIAQIQRQLAQETFGRTRGYGLASLFGSSRSSSYLGSG